MRDLRSFGVVLLSLGVLALVLALTHVALGADMETDLTWREKKLERELRDDVDGGDRYVDFGVLLHVVVADDQGEIEYPGNPSIRLRILRTHHLGGMVDTRSNPPALIGPSENPVVWFCSQDQETILFHDDPEIPGQVIFGSEGSGKTRVLAMLLYVWTLDCLGEQREIGQTAPTRKRLKHVLEAIEELYPADWYAYHKAEQLLTFCEGSRIQFVSMNKRSEAQGSPAQGYNFTNACGRDELQDQLEGDEDLESRGRGSKVVLRTDGTKIIYYKQAATCTAKESSAFRNVVARKLKSGRWLKRVLLIERSPFIHPSFLEEKKLVMTEREFRRRYKAEDLPPEHMLYFNWDRAKHLRAIPTKGARKITSAVIRQKTNNPRHALLAGHDPGIAKSATIFLDAYEIAGIADPVWWVVGELFHVHATTEQQARAIYEHAQTAFRVNVRRGAETLHVRAHPYGQSEKKPSLDLYRIFKRGGLDVRAAQYKKDGTGTGLIKIEDRLDMVNSLMLDAAGRTRLYVAIDARGEPVAPRLVESFETMERDEEGLAEQEKKNEHDKSDPPCALGYGLWPWEKQSAQLWRIAKRKAA